MNLLSRTTLCCQIALLISASGYAYTGYKSSEARLKFDAFVETNSKPTAAAAASIVADHVQYLFGPMMMNSTMAAPKGDEQTQVTQIEAPTADRESYRIHYKYNGTLVMQNGPRTSYTVILPNNPHAAFMKSNAPAGLNPCTDDHYQTEGDFWYFWSPSRPGCGKLLKEDIDYQVIDADLERIPNVTNSRPDYARLPDKTGNIKISLLMGMNDATMITDPLTSEGHRDDDLNAINYRGIRKNLIELGFESRVLTNAEIRRVVKVDVRPLPHVEELVQRYSGGRAGQITVTMFFGRTQINEPSKAFHYYMKDGVENASVVIYDGHSGLGGNIFLPDLESEIGSRFKPNKSQYQIYNFNSCSSYAYYNSMFFNRKKSQNDPKGTKNLDIVTTGLESPFDGGVRADVAFITAIHNWAKLGTLTGYSELMRRLENDDLAGVNGDEDNPTQ